MLVPTSQTSPVLSGRSLACLFAAAVLLCALPTFHAAPAVAEQEKASQVKGKDQGSGAGGKESAAKEPKEAVSKAKSPPKELTVDLGGGVKLELVRIPAGEFLMGSPDSEKDGASDEKPQHKVRITKPFYLGKCLVTPSPARRPLERHGRSGTKQHCRREKARETPPGENRASLTRGHEHRQPLPPKRTELTRFPRH